MDYKINYIYSKIYVILIKNSQAYKVNISKCDTGPEKTKLLILVICRAPSRYGIVWSDMKTDRH